MEILSSGYHIPFHHLPSVTWGHIEFSSYSLVSVEAQALQGGVDKMLRKGAVEEIKVPGWGDCSRLFLVQKASGGWRLVISQQLYYSNQILGGDGVISSKRHQLQECFVLYRFEGHLLSSPDPSTVLTLSSDYCGWESP